MRRLIVAALVLFVVLLSSTTTPYLIRGAFFGRAAGVGTAAADGSAIHIDARANIFGAGKATAPNPAGGGGGFLPPQLALPSIRGQIVTFTDVDGNVSCCNGAYAGGPDGVAGCCGGTDVASYDGVSGIILGSEMALVGVFVGDAEPADPAPMRLNFTATADSAEFSPSLRQTFFIGDGLTGTGGGVVQRFNVPAGATRLFLGFVDAVGFHGLPGSYDDNTGSIDATANLIAPTPQPWKLPYGPYDHVKWTGGPHRYNDPDFNGEIPVGTGSGIDFQREVDGEGVSFSVRAIADGTVEATKTDCPDDSSGLNYGCWVAVRHDSGDGVSVYAHLDQSAVFRSKGDHVDQGQILAFAGKSGNQTNVHLHLELRQGNLTCSPGGVPSSCGDPIDWDGLVIDGWQIHEYFADGEGLTAYNYDGSATKGDVAGVLNFPYEDYGGWRVWPNAVVARVGATFHCDYPTSVPATPTSCEKNAQSKACYATPTPTPSPTGTDCATLTQFATDSDGGVLGSGGGGRAPAGIPNIGATADEDAELISTNLPTVVNGVSVGGIAEQPDLAALPSSSRDYTWYVAAVAVAFLALTGAVVWRRR